MTDFRIHDRPGLPPRLVVEGPLTAPSVADFRSVCDDLVGERAVVVDLERCTDLDAAGIGSLLRCVRRMHDCAGRVVITVDAASPLPLRLRHAGVSRLAPVIERPGLATAS
jgi:hypothetical protein